MKYQVLARKYRPKTFPTMMGQEHVLKALTNALETERLHHAYLFTGTRGVGKTTVARVLAKALNCEQGISASPCGECAACQEIDQGRFIDLIEVDAASKTKVEDTRELLDNVQYAPTRGRFKIYLIDEVHMLSGHSFNALLKTLEEPPPHAKFLLATTDPQKLPVTILSRCLQFNLKSLTIEQIEQQLQYILNAEQIPFAENVLKPLAIAADGSMRDALSLLDQAIAYSNGKPNLADIEAMLGSVQKDRIFALLNALANADGRMLVEQSRILSAQGIDVNTVLAELISTLQRIALCQMVPDVIDDSFGDKVNIEQIAQLISPEDIQLYYQIAINGRKDLPYSPQPQGGFEMILLRMLAFRPDAGTSRQSPEPAKEPQKSGRITQTPASENASAASVPAPDMKKKILQNGSDIKKTSSAQQTAGSSQTEELSHTADYYELPPIDAYEHSAFSDSSEPPEFVQDVAYNDSQQSTARRHKNQQSAENRQPIENKPPAVDKKPLADREPLADKQPSADIESLTVKQHVAENQSFSEKPPSADIVPLFNNEQQKQINAASGSEELSDYWHDLINGSKLDGLEQQLAKHCALVNKTEHNGEQLFELLLESVHKHLLNDKIYNRLSDSLRKLQGVPLKLHIKECQVQAETQLDTPRRREIHEAEVLQQQAVESILTDPKVQMIVNAFSARVNTDSIKPI